MGQEGVMLSWKIFAVGSAFFAGITAILAKIGVKNIPSNLATLLRTIVIFIFFRRAGWITSRVEKSVCY